MRTADGDDHGDRQLLNSLMCLELLVFLPNSDVASDPACGTSQSAIECEHVLDIGNADIYDICSKHIVYHSVLMCIMCITIMLKYPGCSFYCSREAVECFDGNKNTYFVWFLTPALQANVNDYRRSECSKLLMHWDDRGLYEEHGGHRQHSVQRLWVALYMPNRQTVG